MILVMTFIMAGLMILLGASFIKPNVEILTQIGEVALKTIDVQSFVNQSGLGGSIKFGKIVVPYVSIALFVFGLGLIFTVTAFTAIARRRREAKEEEDEADKDGNGGEHEDEDGKGPKGKPQPLISEAGLLLVSGLIAGICLAAAIMTGAGRGAAGAVVSISATSTAGKFSSLFSKIGSISLSAFATILVISAFLKGIQDALADMWKGTVLLTMGAVKFVFLLTTLVLNTTGSLSLLADLFGQTNIVQPVFEFVLKFLADVLRTALTWLTRTIPFLPGNAPVHTFEFVSTQKASSSLVAITALFLLVGIYLRLSEQWKLAEGK